MVSVLEKVSSLFEGSSQLRISIHSPQSHIRNGLSVFSGWHAHISHWHLELSICAAGQCQER